MHTTVIWFDGTLFWSASILQIFILVFFSFWIYQTSQFDAFTNADDLSQIGTLKSAPMNNIAAAELNVRAAIYY